MKVPISTSPFGDDGGICFFEVCCSSRLPYTILGGRRSRSSSSSVAVGCMKENEIDKYCGLQAENEEGTHQYLRNGWVGGSSLLLKSRPFYSSLFSFLLYPPFLSLLVMVVGIDRLEDCLRRPKRKVSLSFFFNICIYVYKLKLVQKMGLWTVQYSVLEERKMVKIGSRSLTKKSC